MRVGVIGAGSWGTTLANLLAKSDHQVTIWAREDEVVDSINNRHVNSLFLPGVDLDSRLKATGETADAVADAEVIVSAAPSHAVRKISSRLRSEIGDNKPPVVSVSKGLDPKTHATMTQIIAEELPGVPVAALSGPSFAMEVARERPTAVVAASIDQKVAEQVQALFSTSYMRVYTAHDVVGVELGGALKNVFAIAAGITDGLGLGDNTRAALLTRGLAEMTRLGVAMGADPLTFSGLAGIGDLMLTATGDQSRNRTFGLEIAKGKTVAQIKEERNTVAEGVDTSKLILDVAQAAGVEMPVAQQIHAVLFEGKTPALAICDLMGRELKPERWS